MNPILRILERTDGSVTTIIEALTGEKVEIKTIEQKVIEADRESARILEIDEGEEVNYRVVEIVSAGEVFARAISITPLSRLDERFRDDLMKADIPIGRIIRKHKLEVRREILWSRIGTCEDLGNCLIRNYNIIHKGEILINITEMFPVDVYDKIRW
ncbi:chorismate pyruvate-lyase family protein [Geoglobus sp.]